MTTQKTNGVRNVFAVGLVYAALTLTAFWPCLGSFSKALIGPPEDNMLLYWYLWNGHECLFAGKTLWHSALIFFPGGVHLLFSTYYYFGMLLTAPFAKWAGPIVVYNILVLYPFVTGGLGTFFLIRYLTKNEWAAFAAGFVFAFNPNHFAHAMHHVHLADVTFAPFLMFFLLKTVREGTKKNLLWAVFFFAMGGLTDWNDLVYECIFLAAAAGYFILRDRKGSSRGFRSSLAVLFLGLLVLSPLIVPVAFYGLKNPFKGAYPGQDIYVADLLGFFIPSVYHALSGWAPVSALNAKMSGTDWEKAVYLGWVNLALVALAWRSIWLKARPYLLGFCFFAVLALGSHPHWLGKVLPIPLPYRLLEMLPFLSNARNPARVMIFGYLFWAVLVGFSVKAVLEKPLSKRAIAILAAVGIFFFADFFSVCAAKTRVELPPAYAPLLADPARDFGILELPYEGGRYQMYQTLHKIPITQGYVNRRSENTLSDSLPYDIRRLDEQKRLLLRYKVKYIFLHKKKLNWDANKSQDLLYERLMEAVSAAYARTYTRIYEDANAATFKVY